MTGSRTAQLTPQERAARGKAARGPVPRSAQAGFAPRPDRADPVAVLEEQSASRLPDLVPVRYARMLESPFRFYRGAAALMAGDLAGTPSTGIKVQLCGDAHLLNFRLLASPERHLMFDINDFDETLPGPWEWDVKRLAASLVIAGRNNGFADAQRSAVVRGAVRTYREWMRRLAAMRHLDVWYTKVDADDLFRLLGDRGESVMRKRAALALAKARTRDHLHAFEKLTHMVKGERRITPDPPLIVPVDDLLPGMARDQLEEQIRGLIERYAQSLPSDRRALLEQFRLVDMARKVVGVGSVGTRCWIILMLGRDAQDPLLLQAKEAQPSALAEYVGPSRYENQGERVVSGQRLMQATSDMMLGWERVEGIDGRERDFYVRQLHDWKGIALPDTMRPRGMGLFGQVCGATLARAHARSGDRIALAAYLGRGDSFDRAVADFAEAYADQNEDDFRALGKAVRAGRVRADPS
ncbi:DUF2252 domain-containing protein [Streptomyces flavofungini]|uniref:DUF2252 domain-containing protein n=1 Tax=Streptomyces flavofungini TaxID=68200 RepID=A0ABS0X909_9ACTN|nr:DUF2252 domain-containing protein [Streptomyces flavofungini]MBJ3809692.1 DUF2252 domain-containing protein [Streptomyces flavofungini]GHC80125.1 hypothetical protein GCM10010349_62390 [Streptomyces flavofungini]